MCRTTLDPTPNFGTCPPSMCFAHRCCDFERHLAEKADEDWATMTKMREESEATQCKGALRDRFVTDSLKEFGKQCRNVFLRKFSVDCKGIVHIWCQQRAMDHDGCTAKYVRGLALRRSRNEKEGVF